MSPPSPAPEKSTDDRGDAVFYAPEYSAHERLRLMALIGLPIALLLAAMEFAGLPRLKAYLAAHPCEYWHGWELDRIVFFALLGGPLLAVLGVSIRWLLIGGLRILRAGQAPPPGVRVWLRTPIRHGAIARRIGYLHLAAFMVLAGTIVAALWLGTRLADTLQAHNPNRCGERIQRSI